MLSGELDEEKYQQMEGAAAPLSPIVRPTSASGMYRLEARRWEDEALLGELDRKSRGQLQENT